MHNSLSLPHEVKEVHRSVLPNPGHAHIPDLTVIVPTINSGMYIDLILGFYAQELGVPVTVFVDDKSKDNTLGVARTYANRAVIIANESTRVGEIIEAMSRQAPRPGCCGSTTTSFPLPA